MGPLIERGISFAEMRKHTVDELILMVSILSRFKATETGASLPTNIGKDRPDLNEFVLRYHMEMERIAKRREGEEASN